jgi:hypothetical protein
LSYQIFEAGGLEHRIAEEVDVLRGVERVRVGEISQVGSQQPLEVQDRPVRLLLLVEDW